MCARHVAGRANGVGRQHVSVLVDAVGIQLAGSADAAKCCNDDTIRTRRMLRLTLPGYSLILPQLNSAVNFSPCTVARPPTEMQRLGSRNRKLAAAETFAVLCEVTSTWFQHTLHPKVLCQKCKKGQPLLLGVQLAVSSHKYVGDAVR